MSAVKTHYSCAELAAMKLPGYPGSERGFINLVERESWPKRQRTGRGGGYEYHPPAAVMKLIQAREKEARGQAHLAQGGLAVTEALELAARQALLDVIDGLLGLCKLASDGLTHLKRRMRPMK